MPKQHKCRPDQSNNRVRFPVLLYSSESNHIVLAKPQCAVLSILSNIGLHFHHPAVLLYVSANRSIPLKNLEDIINRKTAGALTLIRRFAPREPLQELYCSLCVRSRVRRICANCSVSHPLLVPPASSGPFSSWRKRLRQKETEGRVLRGFIDRETDRQMFYFCGETDELRALTPLLLSLMWLRSTYRCLALISSQTRIPMIVGAVSQLNCQSF